MTQLVPDSRYTLHVGSYETTLDIDADSLVYSSGMRGFASLEAEAVLGNCNEVLSNELVVGAAVELHDNGVSVWEGDVVDLPYASPDEPTQRIVAAGRWDRARRNEGYSKWFVASSPYERFTEVPPQIYGSATAIATRNDAITIDTDGQLLVLLPDGTPYKAAQGVAVGFWLFDGVNSAATISRVTCDYVCEPGIFHHVRWYTCEDLWGGSQTPITALLNNITTSTHGTLDVNVSADNARALILVFYSDNASTTSADRYVQIRNLVIYSGTQAKRRIDEAIVEILQTDSAIAASSTASVIGSALDTLLIEPETTIAAGVELIEGLHSLPVLSGIWEDGALTVKEQPTTPPDRTRWYSVSAQQDDLAWDVQKESESVVDYAKVLYDLETQNLCLQPSPTSLTWPSDWYRSHVSNVAVNEPTAGNFVFRLLSDATALNPEAVYRPTGGSGAGVVVKGGATYLMRCRVWIDSYANGSAQVLVAWYTSADVYISTSTAIYDRTSIDATEHWVEGHVVAPTNAYYAKIDLRWLNVTGTPTQYFNVRDVNMRALTPADIRLVEYRPSTPPSLTSRVAVVDAGRTTKVGAQLVGDQYLAHFSTQVSGPVEIPDYVRDIDGRLWPLSHIRAWDWIECSDYIDPARRGPFMVTSCEVQDGVARLGIGGVDTYAYDPPEKVTRGKGRFSGSKRVWKRVRVKVRGRWKWVRRRVLRRAYFRTGY